MISTTHAFILFFVYWLRLLPVAVVMGFHVTTTTTMTTTTTTITQRRRKSCCHVVFAMKEGKDDDNNYDDIERDDFGFIKKKNTNGIFFNPLGDYNNPLTNSNNNNKPNKLDLYSEDELWNVLNIHKLIDNNSNNNNNNNNVVVNNENYNKQNGNDLSKGISPGLHEMVLEALQQMEEEKHNYNDRNDGDKSIDAVLAASSSSSSNSAAVVILTDKLRSKLRKIRAIASDVDGTLVAAKYNVHPTTQAAVIEAVQTAYGGGGGGGDDISSSTSTSFKKIFNNNNNNNNNDSSSSSSKSLQLFFLATGKSRAGAMESLGPVIQNVLLQYSVPGVYIQGLYCVDENGGVIFEKRLTKQAVEAATRFATRHNISMFGYNGDVILSTKEADPKHVQDYHDVWGEPIPIIIDSFMEYPPGFHKILFMSNDCESLTQQIRPKLDALAVENNCATTQAVPNMIELLPAGCSKALGVEKLCQHYGIDPSTQLLAIGDAENDIGMLQMASIGIAVGNASPLVKDVADIVISESNVEGGAGVAITQFGLGKALHQ